MLLPSQNLSTNKKSFKKPQDLALITSKDLGLDQYECCWGLNRGQLDAYRNDPANHLRLQPALKAALNAGRLIILPSDAILRQLSDLQKSNEAGRFENRRLFLEAVPFGTYEYRVIPLKKNVRLYAKDPITQTITPLDPDSLAISADVHPFFLVAYAAEVIYRHHITLSDDSLDRLLFRIRIHWVVLPCLEFVQDSYEGEFGRHLSFRDLKRRHPVPPTPSLTSASTSTYSECSYRSSKRLRSSSPPTEEDKNVNIRQWIARCDPSDLDPVVDNDAQVERYRQEAVISTGDAEENMPGLKTRVSTSLNKRKRA